MSRLIKSLGSDFSEVIKGSFHRGDESCELKLVDSSENHLWLKIVENINYLNSESNSDLFRRYFPDFIQCIIPCLYDKDNDGFSHIMSFKDCRKVVENPKDFTNKIKITFKDME